MDLSTFTVIFSLCPYFLGSFENSKGMQTCPAFFGFRDLRNTFIARRSSQERGYPNGSPYSRDYGPGDTGIEGGCSLIEPGADTIDIEHPAGWIPGFHGVLLVRVVKVTNYS
jgi:hypothetical protein